MISNRLSFPVAAILMILLMPGCDPGNSNLNRKGSLRVKTIQAAHFRNINDIYNSFSYNWQLLDKGVPPLLLRRFPTDIHLINPIQNKKIFFFQSILPMALLGNEKIRQQRETVENLFSIHEAGNKLALHQHEELIKIQAYYKVKGDVLADNRIRTRLLKRVDVIPPSLILAQAANESGWGMSRFAQHANNIFGEWTFTPGTGLVPQGRPEGETYEVRRFEDLFASIKSYLRNLNTHRAYQSMRNVRMRLREKNLPVTGYTLAGEMEFYSTRRKEYVREIRAIIVSNRLEELNALTLLPEAKQPEADPAPQNGGLMTTRDKLLKI